MKAYKSASGAMALLLGMAALAPAHAVIPVIDTGAITQLLSQLRTMQSQLQTATAELAQARSTYSSLTGTRGMQQLLSGELRNYLPATWTELTSVLANASTSYSSLAANIQTVIAANAVLQGTQLASLTPSQRQLLSDGRNATAGLAAMTQAALSTTSQRFADLQQLIQAIATATDPKAIYDLQARVQAEAAMLQNEATKLQTLYQAEEAQTKLRAQRAMELGISDGGSLRNLPSLGL